MNTKIWKNRVLSVALTVIMVISMLPLPVVAAAGGGNTAGTVTEVMGGGNTAGAVTEVMGSGNTADAVPDVTGGDAAANASTVMSGDNVANALAVMNGNTVENAVAEVTAGGTTTQYASIAEAFTAAQEADSATVTLLSDVTIAETCKGIQLVKGNITFDLNGNTLTSYTGSEYTLDIVLGVSGNGGDTPTYATLTLQDSSNGGGKIVQTNGIPAVLVNGYGKLTVEGGLIENSSTENRNILITDQINCAILTSGNTTISGGEMSGINGVVVNGGTLTVEDGTFTGVAGNALIVYDGTAQLSGGTYSNDTNQNQHSIWVTDSGKASSLLAEGYRYETTDGKVSEYSTNGNGVVGNTTVKVRPAGEYSYIGADGEEAVQTDCKELTSEAPS